ncbi:sugar ABC transporter ATP-binding protein [Sulfitobacter sp. JB4-11]|uniref:sugar ABC transporter ATP-binding protein n=1 Tax=Sulfitobacter rhodophyticola TaxID=3238304 RepID=UPI003D816073
MSDAMDRLELRNVSKSFGGTRALDHVNWSVKADEVHCLVGENGSGKSTLIKIVSGVHAADPGGHLLIDGVEQPHLTPGLSKSLGVQVIYQDLSLFPNLTVAENIGIDQLLGPGMGRAGHRQMRRIAQDVLASLDHELPLNQPVGSLPVAQRQVVAICRGLTANARILFMDEPTSSLTRAEVDRLFTLVRRLRGMGVTIVFVSHRMDEIAEIADRVSILRDGVMGGTFDVGDLSDHDLAERLSGDKIVHDVTAKPIPAEPPLLDVSNASRDGEFSDVSFALRRGEILGLTGLLGSGRTELALSLFGMAPLDRGDVWLEGRPLRLRSNQEAIKAGIAYLSEDRLSLGLNLRQSISDNVAISVLDRLGGWLGLVSDDARRALAEHWVRELDLKASDVASPAATLSGGNQQRVVLAKWLATDPKVLILDSPTVGVDIRNKRGIYELIRKLADAGMAILLISDEIPEVYFNTDRVLHMRKGRIAGEFIPGQVSQDVLQEAVYA